MPSVELRWTDYRGDTFRVVREVKPRGRTFSSIVGTDIERGLYELPTGTLLVRRTLDGRVVGGRVLKDGAMFWAVSGTPEQLTDVLSWMRESLQQGDTQ